VARNQVKRTLQQIGIEATLARDGMEGLETLRQWISEGEDLSKTLLMVISDVEMPKMDGYTLTKEIRNDANLQAVHVMLHTSLSGVFNTAMVKKVGADEFLPKYNPDELAISVRRRIEQVEGRA
jgi:two-component system chemotaxis response regulator CheV